jgi:hypothetical protein
LRVLWEYSRDEAATSLMMEFMALGNHRKSILREIADATNRVRQVQLDALTRHWGEHGRRGDRSPAAVLFLITGVPKMLQLEEGFGVTTAHNEVVTMIERYLETGSWEAAASAKPAGSTSPKRDNPQKPRRAL